jgi:hypothetical protein
MVSMNDVFIFLLIIGCLTSLVVGMVIGKFLERKDWNKLINHGVLPTTKKRRKVPFGCGF